MHISEGHKSEAIGGMELLLKKVTACISDFCELEEVGGWEKRLHDVFANFHGSSVDELDEKLHSRRVHLPQGHNVLSTLRKLS